MPCGLSEDALFVLNILYSNRCLASNRGFHSKKLKGLYTKKFSYKFEKTIKHLLNEGYITEIKKKESKYYISNIPKTSFALGSHGYSVTKGKIRPL
jgi:chloramphenicol O-acetyltransferase